jgi:hypothetical protein
LRPARRYFTAFRSEEGGDDGDEDGCGLQGLSTWVKNAAIKTIENGAATASPATRRRVPSGLNTNKKLVGGTRLPVDWVVMRAPAV